MERNRVVAAATSTFGAAVVGACAIGLNIGVLRAGRTLHKVVVTNAADPATSDSPASAELVVEDLVPLVIPLNALTGAAPSGTAAGAPATTVLSVASSDPSDDSPAPTETEPENETETATSAAAPAPPPATSATTAHAPEPKEPVDHEPGDDETSEHAAPSQPPSTGQPPTAVKSQTFTLPRQAGTAQIGVGGTTLTLQQVKLAPGWNYSCEAPQGQEIQLKLSGPGGNFEFTIKLENGHVTTEGG